MALVNCFVFLLLLFSSLGLASSEDRTHIPEYSSPVMDGGGLFSLIFKQEASRQLESIWQAGGPQIAVFTVVSLGGETIEQLSIRTVDKWKLGSDKKDDGVLLLIAGNDRKVRLEVGRGLEGEITDAVASQILNQDVIPLLKVAQYEKASRVAIGRVLLILGHKLDDPWWQADQLSKNIPMPKEGEAPETRGFFGAIYHHATLISFKALQFIGLYGKSDDVPNWLEFFWLLAMFPLSVAVAISPLLLVSYLLSLLPGRGRSSSSDSSSGYSSVRSSSTSSGRSSSYSSSRSSSSKGGGGGFSGGGASGSF